MLPTRSLATKAAANPFSSCRTCRIPFQFSNERTKASLCDRFIELGELAQIVGPHGTGKTTLAVTLGLQLAARFHKASLITIRRRKGSWWGMDVEREPLFEKSEPVGSPRSLMIIDGIETLSSIHRRLMIASFRQRAIGLMVTTHRAIPNLGQLSKPELTQADFFRLVDRLLRNFPRLLSKTTMESAWRAAGGHCRQAFDRLYDEYESAANSQVP